MNRFAVFLLIFFSIFFRTMMPGPARATTPPETEDTCLSATQTDFLTKTQPSTNILDSLFSLYQPYLKNISAYKPIYFLVGADPSETRFQFSFRYRFLSPGLSVVQRHHWIQGFHIAYTQTSFWDLEGRSQPFKDSSYMPEIFFLSPSLVKKYTRAAEIFFQTGYQHESNGQDEDLSRSTNFFYIKPLIILFNKKNDFGVQIAPRVWTYVGNDDNTNPDLCDYRGYFDLEIKVGKAKGLVFASLFRHAKQGSSVQVDVTYPLNNLFENIDLYLQLQYVNALAENLINYQERSRAFRIGFSIVR